jgi:hypothetical protein
MRMDIDGAYRRIRLRVEQITLMALVFTLIIAGIPTPMVQLPLAAQFGSQDSNYIYQMVSGESNQQALVRSLGMSGAQLGSVYIDDSSTFAPPWYLDIEQLAHTRTSEDLVGSDPSHNSPQDPPWPCGGSAWSVLRLPRSHGSNLLDVLPQVNQHFLQRAPSSPYLRLED